MRLETPFTGKLAVLGERGRSGHLLSLDGIWDLHPAAVVVHQTRIGELEFGGATVIGEIQRVGVMPQTYGQVLMAWGVGASWLAELLDSGTHALSMEMDLMTRMTDHYDIGAGRVRGALLVRADAFGWAGVSGG